MEKLGSQKEAILLGVIALEVQLHPSIHRKEVMEIETPTEGLWTTPIWEYIIKGLLPKYREESQKLKYKAPRYVIYNGKLYKRGFNQYLFKCITESECEYIMREVHEGICGNHSSGTSLAQKILR